MTVHRPDFHNVALCGQLHLAREVTEKEELPRHLGLLKKPRSPRGCERGERGCEFDVVLKRECSACPQLQGAARCLLVRAETSALAILHIGLLLEKVHSIGEPDCCKLCSNRLPALWPRAERDALDDVYQIPQLLEARGAPCLLVGHIFANTSKQ